MILPRLAHPEPGRARRREAAAPARPPDPYEGGSAVLRPCIGVATLPEHGFDPAGLLMAADVARHIAATREEGYHVFQGDEVVEAEVYHGLDLDARARPSRQRARAPLPAAGGPRHGRARSASRPWCAGGIRRPGTSRPRRSWESPNAPGLISLAHALDLQRGTSPGAAMARRGHRAAARAQSVGQHAGRSRAARRHRPGHQDLGTRSHAHRLRSGRKLGARRSGAFRGHPHAPEGARRADFARRFRLGLHLARAPEAPSHRRGQDRPALRRGLASRTPATRRSCARPSRPRAQLRLPRGGRGHRAVRDARSAREPRLRPGARDSCSPSRCRKSPCATGGAPTRHEARVLHDHGGAVLLVARRQRAAHRRRSRCSSNSTGRRG